MIWRTRWEMPRLFLGKAWGEVDFGVSRANEEHIKGFRELYLNFLKVGVCDMALRNC